ncbi:MAG: hypothetical protein E6I19_09260 [Chloroflexi bacterium]|nr:MAG: hypothetical protein E6I48_12245 [Chloroflexota bacterium]TMF55014.1 MAG: hypothetical protein E6I19_09260 [Chloroflexota bacterium]
MRVLIAMATALVLLAGCAAQGAQPGTGGQVSVTLTDTGVTLAQTSVSSGPVTFKVKNAGSIVHELVVVRTDIAQDKIQPNTDEPSKMSEEGTQGESGDLEAGLTKDFTLNLSAGKYVLMCNQPGHYMAGMHIAFVVR